MASLPIVLAEASTTCSLGPGLSGAIFSPFYPLRKSPSRGAKCKKNTLFFCAPSLPRVARVKRGAESALERFEELQKEVKKSLFSESCRI